MKRLFINIAFLGLVAGGFSSCKKTIADNYLNPELVATGSLSNLMSGLFVNPRIHPSYYDFATFIMPTTAAFTQLTALSPAPLMYTPSLDYNRARWEHYYTGSMPTDGSNPDYNYNGPGIMSNYREMQTTYAALSPAEQAKQLVFMKCAQVILYDQTAQMIDLWGDIPFSQAGSLNTSGRTLVNPVFDNAAAVYDTLIAGLNDLNTYFATATLLPEIQATLKTQDLLMGGDLSWWQRYTNSLRLRLLMRISYFNESEARTAVTAMLASPSTYPMITGNQYNVLLNESSPTLKSDIHDALTSSPFAPDYLVSMMVANADPRTTFYWDSAQNSSYVGFPVNGTVSQYQAGKGIYATYDSATFFYNYNVPGVLFTAAETSFLTAEANERWGAGTIPASQAYANGITQSVGFYYSIYASRVPKQGYAVPTANVLPAPSQAAIDAYIANVPYSGTTDQKLQLIATQNWTNFFILQAGQAWAELRRTKYPVLTFAPANLASASQPPTRLLYPASEQLYNAANYAAVAAKDTRSTKIFWDVK